MTLGSNGLVNPKTFDFKSNSGRSDTVTYLTHKENTRIRNTWYMESLMTYTNIIIQISAQWWRGYWIQIDLMMTKKGVYRYMYLLFGPCKGCIYSFMNGTICRPTKSHWLQTTASSTFSITCLRRFLSSKVSASWGNVHCSRGWKIPKFWRVKICKNHVSQKPIP